MAASNPAQAAFKRMFGVLDGEPAVEAGLRLELDEFDRHWSTHDVPDDLRRFFARRSAG